MGSYLIYRNKSPDLNTPWNLYNPVTGEIHNALRVYINTKSEAIRVDNGITPQFVISVQGKLSWDGKAAIINE